MEWADVASPIRVEEYVLHTQSWSVKQVISGFVRVSGRLTIAQRFIAGIEREFRDEVRETDD